MIYQIIAWPRSRTAWLSNFLTYGPSFCFHEAIYLKGYHRLRTKEEYTNLFNLYAKKYQYLGDANTIGLMTQKYTFKHARVVVIERDLADVEKSLINLGYSNIHFPKVVEYPYNETLVVKFEEIDNRLEEIWNFCLPGLKFPQERAVQQCALNIQVNNINDYLIKSY